MCTLLVPSYAQEVSELTDVEREAIITQLEKDADNAKSPKERKVLTKIGEMFKDLGKSKIVKKTGRGLGKATTFIATETLRPFVKMTSFMKGASQKLDDEDTKTKNEIFSFYLDNEKELNQLYKDKSQYGDLVKNGENGSSIMEDYKILVENMMKQKALKTVLDILKEVNFNPMVEVENADGTVTVKALLTAISLEELSAMLNNLDITNPDNFSNVDFEKLNNDTVRKNMKCNKLGVLAPYVDIEPLKDEIFGDIISSVMTGEDLNIDIDPMSAIDANFIKRIQDFIASFGDFEDGKIWKNAKIVDEMSEGVTSLVAQYAVPSVVLGTIGSGLGGLYAGVTAASTVGAAISTAVCASKKNYDKIEADEDLRNFCSFVVFRTSQKLLKSKAKGFLNGQNVRKNILGHQAALKDRKVTIKSCAKEENKSKKECRLEYKLDKINEIKACVESGKSKKECRKQRRENLRQQHQLN